jgi:Domain of unknown function (DUF3372)
LNPAGNLAKDNSGDLDWSYRTNNFGVGLPLKSENDGDWSVRTPFLLNPAITVSDCAGMPLDLHPVLSRSIADPMVRDSRYHEATGTFVIPPRTTAVFVENRFLTCSGTGDGIY